jgi:Flp pilus assembly protein TadG
MMRPLRSVRRSLRAPAGFARGEGGAAAAEFAIWVGALIVPVLSVVDLSSYIQRKMQVDMAAQAALQAAWHNCDVPTLPAVQNCANVVSMMTTAAQLTSLGSAVTLSGVTEDYYCVNSSNALVRVGTSASPGTAASPPVKPSPFDCHTVTPPGSTAAPGDYLTVTTSYAYTPIFNGVSLAALLTTPITKTAWIRLN